MGKEIQIEYADFVRLCNVNDHDDWLPFLSVQLNGVWVKPPTYQDTMLSGREISGLSEHPQKDLSKPALSFPCSLTEFEDFLQWSGGSGYVNQNELDNFVREQKEANKSDEEFVAKMKSLGKQDKEIAAAVLEKYSVTDHRLGELLPASPGVHIEYDSIRKRGQRLRKKATGVKA